MRVYRVQDGEGFGPYRAEKVLGWTLQAGISEEQAANFPATDRWPMHGELPWNMIGAGDGDNVRFGFADPEQLSHWFTKGERKALADNGFSLTVWDAPAEAVWPGRAQVAFDASRATLIETRDLRAEIADAHQEEIPW